MDKEFGIPSACPDEEQMEPLQFFQARENALWNFYNMLLADGASLMSKHKTKSELSDAAEAELRQFEHRAEPLCTCMPDQWGTLFKAFINPLRGKVKPKGNIKTRCQPKPRARSPEAPKPEVAATPKRSSLSESNEAFAKVFEMRTKGKKGEEDKKV